VDHVANPVAVPLEEEVGFVGLAELHRFDGVVFRKRLGVEQVERRR
jgi:hypothetical protein